MRILFLTGNEHKLAEAKAILDEHDVEGFKVNLPEIQSLDPKEIIRAKLAEARKLLDKDGGGLGGTEAVVRLADVALMVEDVSAFAGDTGLPGPFLKFFLQTLGRKGLVRFCRAFDTDRWRVECHLGLLLPDEEEPRFFTGVVEGTVVDPRGESGFGFDPIVQPDGHDQTFAEMSGEEKNRISHRRKALEQARAFLKTNL